MIFLTISIRLLVFCGVSREVTRQIARCRQNKKIKDRLRLSWTYLRAFGGRQTAEVCSKFFLKRHFGGENKLLNLASRTVNYGALNGPIIAHVLTERYKKWFYSIIFAFKDLKIPDQKHHCAHAQLVQLFYAKPLPPTFFASTSAVTKYQLS